jgi:hypothetical protein
MLSTKLMRRTNGLEKIHQQHPERLNIAKLAEILLKDLQDCQCDIYGSQADDEKIMLAKLTLLPDSLGYDAFEQRIDLLVSGPILRTDCVPLTYSLQGHNFGVSGRCSMIPNICGVDLYLPSSYTEKIGDIARLKFSFALKPLLKPWIDA